MRRALYGSERLSALDLDSYLPDLIGPTEVLTDEYRKQLAKHLPARVEGECFYHKIRIAPLLTVCRNCSMYRLDTLVIIVREN